MGCGLVTPRAYMGLLTWGDAEAGHGWPVRLVYRLFVMCVSSGSGCYILDVWLRQALDLCLASKTGRPDQGAGPHTRKAHTMSWHHALMVLLHVLHTHHVHHWHWFTYGYSTWQGHKPSNAGVVVDLGHGKCIGYETRGETGFFGNVFGFKGGDCS